MKVSKTTSFDLLKKAAITAGEKEVDRLDVQRNMECTSMSSALEKIRDFVISKQDEVKINSTTSNEGFL